MTGQPRQRFELARGLGDGGAARQGHDRRERDQRRQQDGGRNRAGQGDGDGDQQRADPRLQRSRLELAEIAIDGLDLVDHGAGRLADRRCITATAAEHDRQRLKAQIRLNPKGVSRRDAGRSPPGQGAYGERHDQTP